MSKASIASEQPLRRRLVEWLFQTYLEKHGMEGKKPSREPSDLAKSYNGATELELGSKFKIDGGRNCATTGMGKVPLCRFKLPLYCFALPLTAATRASLGVQLPRKPAAARCIIAVAADCRNNTVASAECSTCVNDKQQ
ncbi:hypothetical protein GGX14DRAFT_395956 [Mycena pura]|uniref:Uncharacterized protein n=1 Tax=Mycena pura TaxID=153505 RepID=A0AAD6Y970_9AGAR|nr:hypothetical protein GGX14DRAFT_395956 [Mycena pura]